MNQTFITLPANETLPKGFFDVFPDLKTIYWNHTKISIDVIPSDRDLVIIFPREYSYDVVVPERIAVVLDIDDVCDDGLGEITQPTYFAWRKDDSGFTLSEKTKPVKGFQDGSYDHGSNWFVAIKKGEIDTSIKSFSDYWKKEEVVTSDAEVIISSAYMIEGLERSNKIATEKVNEEALEIANEVKRQVDEAIELGELGRTGMWGYTIQGDDHEAVYQRLMKHLPGLSLERDGEDLEVHNTAMNK